MDKKKGILAFCGAKGAGKSTAATLFKDLANFPTAELAFAGPLKKACSEAFHIPYENCINPELKEAELSKFVVLDQTNLRKLLALFGESDVPDNLVRPHCGKVLDTARAVLQYIGTEVLHPVDTLIHVKAALKEINNDVLTVITDLRFVHEFDYLKETYSEAFVPVYIQCLKAEERATEDSHASERQLDLFKKRCTVVTNNGTIEEFSRQLQELVKNHYES